MSCLQVVHYGGAYTGGRAPAIIRAIRLPSYDAIFPLSAESALTCTIPVVCFTAVANNNLRNSMNKFVRGRLDTHPMNCSVRNHMHFFHHTSTTHQCKLMFSHMLQNTPKSQTGNLLHPLTEYCPKQTLPKNHSCTSSDLVMSVCAKEDK